MWAPGSSISCNLHHKLFVCRVPSTKHGIVAKGHDIHKQLASEGKNICQLSPQLQSEWMADRNTHLNSTDIRPYSHFKAWWSCSNCPDGHPHIWEARVADRSYGSKCPYCTGREVCKHNSLATISPASVKYWHKQRNLPLTPDTVLAGSNARAHWLCSTCLHEWKCQI